MKKENIFMKIWRVIYMPIVYLLISIIIGIVGMIFLSIMVGVNMSLSGQQVDVLNLENEIMNSYYQYAMLFTVIAALITVPICYFLMKKDKKRESQINGEIHYEKIELINYLSIVLLGVVSCIGLNNLLTVSGIINVFPGYEEIAEAIYGGGIIIQILSVVVVVPILEEMLFRGIVFKRLRGYMTPKIAIITSALIFGVYHMNVVQGIYAFAIGLLLAFVYEKYKSIWAPIIFHMAANAMSVFLTQVSETGGIFDNMVFFIILTIVTLVLTVFVTLWVHKNINPVEKKLDRSVSENV